MSAFDPFTATFEDAEAQPDAYGEPGAVARFISAQSLLSSRDFYEKNPLDGIAICTTYDLVAPDWLARAFLRGFYAVRRARLGSWDEAFGRPHPKGAQLAAKRRRQSQRVEVALLIHDFVCRHPDLPMESLWGLFEPTREEQSDVAPEFVERARRIGTGKSKAQELYTEALAAGLAIDHNAVRARLTEPRATMNWRDLQAVTRDFVKTPG